MGKIAKALRVFWLGANALSTLQWLLGLLPAGMLALITGAFAKAEHLPPVVIAVLMLTVAAVAYVSYVALLLHRRQERPRYVYDVDPAPERIGIGDEIEAQVVRPTQGRLGMGGVPFPPPRPNQISEAAKADQDSEALRKSELAEKRKRKREEQALARSREGLRQTLDLAEERLRQSRKYREVSIYEALGWAMYAQWGKGYDGFMGIPVTLGPTPDPWKFLTRFVRLASEGKLTLWGKRQEPGYIEEIPRSYWNEHGLKLARDHPLIPRLVTSNDDDPYRDLELNRAEVEAAWPHAGRPPNGG